MFPDWNQASPKYGCSLRKIFQEHRPALGSDEVFGICCLKYNNNLKTTYHHSAEQVELYL